MATSLEHQQSPNKNPFLHTAGSKEAILTMAKEVIQAKTNELGKKPKMWEFMDLFGEQIFQLAKQAKPGIATLEEKLKFIAKIISDDIQDQTQKDSKNWYPNEVLDYLNMIINDQLMQEAFEPKETTGFQDVKTRVGSILDQAETITLDLDAIATNAQKTKEVKYARNSTELCYHVTAYVNDHTDLLPTGLLSWATAEGDDLTAHTKAINAFTETCLNVGAQIYKQRYISGDFESFPLDTKEFVREMQDHIDEALRLAKIGNPDYGQTGAYQGRRISHSDLSKTVEQFNEERWELVDDIFDTIN